MRKSSLERLFRPKSIAIVGASASPEKAGYMAVELLEGACYASQACIENAPVSTLIRAFKYTCITIHIQGTW